MYWDREIPCGGTMEKRRWFCSSWYILFLTFLCYWRAGSTGEPSDLPLILCKIQWFGQHRTYWKALFWICHVGNIGLQFPWQPNILEGWLYRIKLQVLLTLFIKGSKFFKSCFKLLFFFKLFIHFIFFYFSIKIMPKN